MALGVSEEEHMQLVMDCCEQSRTDRDPRRRRSSAWQHGRRQQEQRVRVHAARCHQHLAAEGWTLDRTAAHLHVAPGTLKHWLATARHDGASVLSLGRPLQSSPPAVRNEVLRLLGERGPGVSMPTLRERFPDLARGELDNLLGRYRRCWRRRHRQALHVLHWQVPGAVWAMDFAQPPAPIEGRYPSLLTVLDLASGQQLLWLPVADETAATVILALSILVQVHGAPLVVKTDNGPAFGSDALLAFWDQVGVVPLFSPPYCPQYNGSIEARNGSLKTRSEARAERDGHPGAWTRSDVAAAQTQTNQTVPPKGPRAHEAPVDRWARRPRLQPAERVLFQEAVARLRGEALQEEPRLGKEPPNEMSQRALDRKAISRALVERGYLLFKRRRIPLAIKRPTQLTNR
jgi:transposase InsO family protein